MVEKRAALDVFLRGDRTYIQGTQILARLSELLPKGDWALGAVGFTGIVDSRVVAVELDGEAGAPATARVAFEASDGSTLGFAVLPGDGPAPRSDRPMGISVDRVGGDEDSAARYRFAGVRGFEDALNVIVQAIKSECSRRWPQAQDIWLTGVRRFPLPTQWSGPDAGHVDITLARQLGVSGQVQTIWSVTMPEADCAGTVTFTFKLADPE